MRDGGSLDVRWRIISRNSSGGTWEIHAKFEDDRCWDTAPFSGVEVDLRFRGAYCVHHYDAPMMEAVCTSETSVYFNETTRRYISEGCHLGTRRLKYVKFHCRCKFLCVVTPRGVTAKDGGSMFLRNGGIYLQVRTGFQRRPTRQSSLSQAVNDTFCFGSIWFEFFWSTDYLSLTVKFYCGFSQYFQVITRQTIWPSSYIFILHFTSPGSILNLKTGYLDWGFS
jgi:hypothetical protein